MWMNGHKRCRFASFVTRYDCIAFGLRVNCGKYIKVQPVPKIPMQIQFRWARAKHWWTTWTLTIPAFWYEFWSLRYFFSYAHPCYKINLCDKNDGFNKINLFPSLLSFFTLSLSIYIPLDSVGCELLCELNETENNN